jgi:galactonate dehydratase
MKISAIETFYFSPPVGNTLLFVRVTTDDGLYGWGEAYVGGGQPRAVAEHIAAMTRVLIGRNPLHIRQLALALFDDFAIRQVSFDSQCAWSAIEIALWDILGKHANLPVYQLLGGPTRSEIRVYANGWWIGAQDLDDVIRRAVAVVASGYDAIKWDPIPGPRRTFISRRDEDESVVRLFALRDAVGPDVEIMIDGHRRLSPTIATRLAKRFSEAGITWYEEPCPPENLAETAQVRRDIDLPVVVGEAFCTREQFLPVFALGAADIINPDVCAVGGISAMLDIAALAQLHAVAVSPHNSNSTLIGLAAAVHVSALIPNFTIAEVFVNLTEACDAIASPGLKVEGGWIALPEKPGLGVDIDVAALQRLPYQEKPPRKLRELSDEYPARQ